MEEIKNAHKILGGKPYLEIKYVEDQDEDGRITLICIFREMGFDDRMSIQLIQDCVWLVLSLYEPFGSATRKLIS